MGTSSPLTSYRSAFPAAAALLCAFLLIPSILFAQWSDDPAAHLEVSSITAVSYQTQPDGEGGVYVVWKERISHRTVRGRIYGQHIDKDGYKLWGSDGLLLSDSTYEVGVPGVTADSAGGIIAAWSQGNPASIYDTIVMVKRYAADGTELWATPVWGTYLEFQRRRPTRLAADGKGGAYILPDMTDSFSHLLAVQHVTEQGQVSWSNEGTMIRENLNRTASGQTMIPDTEGGVYIAWNDHRDASMILGATDIYVQRLDSNGAALWQKNGVVISSPYQEDNAAALALDGTGGVFVSYWHEHSHDSDFVALQRVRSNGTPVWDSTGITIPARLRTRPVLQSGPNGTAIVAYYGYHGLTPGLERPTKAYIQRIDSNGTQMWNNGLPVDIADSSRVSALVVSEDGSVFIPALQFDTSMVTRWLWMQKLSSEGHVLWGRQEKMIAESGRILSWAEIRFGERPSALIPDGEGGVIAVWIEGDTTQILHAARFNSNGHAYPVELLAFSGRIHEGTSYLSWITETETNNYGFYIERSPDEQRWEELGFVPGSGTSTQRNEYSFIDDISGQSGTVFYYRLKQVDYNGTHSYSPVIELQRGIVPQEITLEVYPQPAAGQFNVEVSNPSEDEYTLELTDLLGQTIRTIADGSHSGGAAVYPVQVPESIAPGMYFIRLRSEQGTRVQRILITK